MAAEFYCDYCGNVIEGESASIEVGRSVNAPFDIRTTRYDYCAGTKGDRGGSCFNMAHRCLDHMKEWAHREEGAGLVWQLRRLPRVEEAADPKPRSTAPVEGTLPLDVAGLHPRAALALRRAGVRTLEEAAARSEVELLAVEGVGKRTASLLAEALAVHDLTFRAGPTPEQLGERIRELRGRVGLTRTELAVAIWTDGDDGFYHDEVAAWEAGRRVPTPKRLERLAAKFGVSVEQFTDTEAVV